MSNDKRSEMFEATLRYVDGRVLRVQMRRCDDGSRVRYGDSEAFRTFNKQMVGRNPDRFEYWEVR
jgi:hypothetical protein